MERTFGALPAAHQTMLLTHRAMVRDLDRTARAADRLARAQDAERAAALTAYVDMLFQVIEHHHEGEDEYLWPALREAGADEDALALLTAEHEELTKALHGWHEASGRLSGGGADAARELADLTARLREQLAGHARDEERELSGRLAPALDERIWKVFARRMRQSAPGWTLRFMPSWLLSVAEPGERGGVPARPIARIFSGWLERWQRAAFGEAYRLPRGAG